MRLDRTRIVISERSHADVLDLSFLLLRELFVPIVGWTLLLALPFALLNQWLIGWMAAELIENEAILRYVANMAMLVYVQAPLASSFATAYLGKLTFHEQLTPTALIKEVASVGHRLLWTQFLLRGVLLVMWLVYTIEVDDSLTPAEGVLIPSICFILFSVRCVRPYLNEIVILERSPLRDKAGGMTVGKRSSRLHGQNSADLFGRGVLMIPVTLSLGFAIWGSIWFFVGVFSNSWDMGPVMVHVVTPCVLWLLVVYATVVRFLSYLDLRIRTEGWEVELKMRAEAIRLAPHITVGG